MSGSLWHRLCDLERRQQHAAPDACTCPFDAAERMKDAIDDIAAPGFEPVEIRTWCKRCGGVRERVEAYDMGAFRRLVTEYHEQPRRLS